MQRCAVFMVDQENSNIADQKIPSPNRRFGSRKAKIIVLLTLALLIALSGLGFYIVKMKKNAPRQKLAAQHQKDPDEPTPDKFFVPTTPYEKTIASADTLRNKQDYDGAIKLLEQYEPKTKQPAERYAITGRLGSLYARKKDYKTALKWYEQAQQTGQPDADSQYTFIADAAEKTGDKPKAVEAYKKLIELQKANPNPASEDTISVYEAKIKSLGG